MPAGRILVVDDEEVNLDICSRRLERSGYLVSCAGSGPAALEAIAKHHFDVVLLDQMMPEMSGTDVVKRLRGDALLDGSLGKLHHRRSSDIAIIMVTAVTESARIAEALDCGADDYITKPVDYPVALARIRMQLNRRKAAESLRRSEERYALAARGAQDGLWEWDFRTGRVYYSVEWKAMLGFVEDDIGTMPSEWLDRIHPEERAAFEDLLDRHMRGQSETLECQQRVKARDGRYRWMSVHGMSVRDAHGEPLRLAGTQRAMTEPPRRNLQMESELRRAIQDHEFEVYYQPRIRLSDGAICGFEALVRWRHPQRGLVPPNDFIPLAEDNGMILEIGEMVLREACRQTQIWQQQFPRQPRLDIAVNLSARQCAEPGIVAKVAAVLHETGLAPESLHLELTESLVLDDMEEARLVLAGLKAMGVGLKIDDFGTGYSSLRYLRELPFDTLKIDRSFTMGLHLNDPGAAEMVHTILTMARNLHLDVIAEGVERAEHVLELRRLGCKFGQGFYFSKPVTADEIARLLTSPVGLLPSPAAAANRTGLGAGPADSPSDATPPFAAWDAWNHRGPDTLQQV